MIVASRQLWFAATNAYVVAPESGGPCVLIDAPPDPAGLAGLLAEHDLYPVAVLLTHGHIDHAGGAAAIMAPGTPGYSHPDDDFLAMDPAAQLRSMFGVDPALVDIVPPAELRPLADGRRLELAGIVFDVLHTPGHTPGHCCFHVETEGKLFSGDQLFAGSVGRTDFPYGSHEQLMTSMRDKVVTLPPDTEVLPGHGPSTTIGTELATNPFLRELVG